jgi:hypothetical protein
MCGSSLGILFSPTCPQKQITNKKSTLFGTLAKINKIGTVFQPK